MTAGVRWGCVLGVVVLSIACESGARLPTFFPAPSGVVQPPVSPASPQPTRPVPPLTGPSTVYEFAGQLSYPVSPFTTASRYVLYETGAFSFHYTMSGRQYAGSYDRDGATVTFYFQTDTNADATGTLTADVLEIRYTLNMTLSDFEDAAYQRSP
jgi:hypothetical protein